MTWKLLRRICSIGWICWIPFVSYFKTLFSRQTCWVFDHLNRFFLFYFSACLSSRAPTWVGTYRRLAGIFAIVGTAYGHDQEWWWNGPISSGRVLCQMVAFRRRSYRRIRGPSSTSGPCSSSSGWWTATAESMPTWDPRLGFWSRVGNATRWHCFGSWF